MKVKTLKALADLLNSEFRGDAEHILTGIAPLDSAKQDQLSFLANPAYSQHLNTTQAGAVILHPKFADSFSGFAILNENPYLCYAKLSQEFAHQIPATAGIDPTATVHPSAQIHESAAIGPGCYIGADARIGANVILRSQVAVYEHAEVGEHTVCHHGVTLYHGVQLGSRVVVHAGTVIGSDGFGFAPDKQGVFHKIEQIGRVIIGDDVEIGANTTIDRGALGDTVLMAGVKLDNQVQVGHNVVIGAHTVVAGCAGIAGSTKIGAHCMIGGAVGIAGHLEITDQVHLTGMAMVTHSIKKPGVYSSGTGLSESHEWRRQVARMRRLEVMSKKIKALEARIAEIEQ